MSSSTQNILSDRSRVSVAMCTFNGSRYVGMQIDSILGQSVPVDELVVSDDGSTDGTIEIVRQKFRGLKSPQLVILEGGRLGITKNFERALSACSGDLLFLCDQDDIWLPGKVEKLLAFMERNPDTPLAFSDAHLVDADARDLGVSQFEMVRLSKRLIKNISGDSPFATLLRRSVVTGATVVLRRDLLAFARPFVDGWLHDEWLAICAAAKGKLGIIAEPLVLYRQHASNHCGMRRSSVKSKVLAAANCNISAQGSVRLERLIDRLGDSQPVLHQHLLRALEFERGRGGLGRAMPKRLIGVLRLSLSGGYFRYSDGFRSLVKDLLAK